MANRVTRKKLGGKKLKVMGAGLGAGGSKAGEHEGKSEGKRGKR